MYHQRRVGPRRGTVTRPGFTLIEVLLVALILAIVGGIAAPQISKAANQRTVNNARDAFIRTAAQARAAAIQTGDEVEMRIDPASDRVTVVAADGDTLAILDLRNGPIRASLSIRDRSATAGEFLACYVPRGYARPDCGNESVRQTVDFVGPGGKHTAAARLTISQAERL